MTELEESFEKKLTVGQIFCWQWFAPWFIDVGYRECDIRQKSLWKRVLRLTFSRYFSVSYTLRTCQAK